MLPRMLLIHSPLVCPLTEPVMVAASIRLDLRYDYLDQKQYRSGSNKTSKSAVDSQEKRNNHYVTAGIDYSFSRGWGVLMFRSIILIGRMEKVVVYDPASFDCSFVHHFCLA